MDLLEHARTLVARGGSTHHSCLQTLQTIKQEKLPNETKAEVKSKTEQNNTSTNNFLLIGGLVLIGIVAILVIGY
jgi:CHASE3 domain sensor protein